MTYIFKNFEGPIDLATAHYELIEYAKSVSPEWELTPICPGAPQKHHRAPASLARGVKVTLEMGELEVRFGDGSLHTVCNSCPPEHLTRLQTKMLLHLSPLLNPDLKSKLLPRIALWPVPHHVGTHH